MIFYCLVFLLLSNAVSTRKDKSLLYSRLVIIILLFSIILLLDDLSFNNLRKSVTLYGGSYHATSLTHVFHIFVLILNMTIIILASFYPKKFTSSYYLFSSEQLLNKTSKQYRILEYPIIILFITLGNLFLINISDLISIFLSIELQSYGLYIICTLYRNSELSTQSGLTYFLLGGLSSCFILLGSSILYVNSGTTFIQGLYIISKISDITYNEIDTMYWYKSYYIYISLLIMSVGFLFKLSASPFHFWSPDVYDGIPTNITIVVAILGKVSIFILLLQLINFTYSKNWTIIILISSLLSLIVGTVGGLTQYRIKRLYAYSTISHTGFLLLALSINSIDSIQAFFFYLIQYSFSNLNAFVLLLSIGYTYFLLLDKKKFYKHIREINNSPIQYIEQLKGYFYINSFLALSMVITLFSLVGIPPLVGFFGKLLVLSAALNNGYIYMALVGILTSVISAVYYLLIVRHIFFYNADLCSIRKNMLIKKKITISSSLTLIISMLTLIILLFILVPQELWDMTVMLSIKILN